MYEPRRDSLDGRMEKVSHRMNYVTLNSSPQMATDDARCDFQVKAMEAMQMVRFGLEMNCRPEPGLNTPDPKKPVTQLCSQDEAAFPGMDVSLYPCTPGVYTKSSIRPPPWDRHRPHPPTPTPSTPRMPLSAAGAAYNICK